MELLFEMKMDARSNENFASGIFFANSKSDIKKIGLTITGLAFIISSHTNSSNSNSSGANYFVRKYMKEGKYGEKEENWS